MSTEIKGSDLPLEANMKTYYKECGCTASITEKADGSARLVVKNQFGKKVKDSTHKSKNAAVAAWRRFCN